MIYNELYSFLALSIPLFCCFVLQTYRSSVTSFIYRSVNKMCSSFSYGFFFPAVAEIEVCCLSYFEFSLLKTHFHLLWTLEREGEREFTLILQMHAKVRAGWLIASLMTSRLLAFGLECISYVLLIFRVCWVLFYGQICEHVYVSCLSL